MGYTTLLPPICDVHSAQISQLYHLLDTRGPATAWAALQATGNVAAFPESVVTALRQQLRTALDRPKGR